MVNKKAEVGIARTIIVLVLAIAVIIVISIIIGKIINTLL